MNCLQNATCDQAHVGQDSVLPVAGVSDSANPMQVSSKGTRLQSSPELSGRRPDPPERFTASVFRFAAADPPQTYQKKVQPAPA